MIHLPVSQIPEPDTCDCPEHVAKQGRVLQDIRYNNRRKLREQGDTIHKAEQDPEIKLIQAITRNNPTGKGNNLYSKDTHPPHLFVIHFPWTNSRIASHRKVDKKSISSRIRAQNQTTRIGFCRIHFTISWAGYNRFRNYYPIKTMQELELEFFETYQGVPIQLTPRQIRQMAREGKISRMGKPGYALHGQTDIYSGLPAEFQPENATEAADSPPDTHQTPTAMAPIFPTVEQMETLFTLIVAASRCQLDESRGRKIPKT